MTKTQKCTILNSSPEKLEKNMAFFQWQKTVIDGLAMQKCVFFSRVRLCVCKRIQQFCSFLQQLCTLPWLSMLGLRYITILQYWPFSNLVKPLAMQYKKGNMDQVHLRRCKWQKTVWKLRTFCNLYPFRPRYNQKCYQRKYIAFLNNFF